MTLPSFPPLKYGWSIFKSELHTCLVNVPMTWKLLITDAYYILLTFSSIANINVDSLKNVLVNFLKKKMTLLASIAGIVPENATFKLHDVRQSPFKMCWSKLTIVWIINKFLKIAYKLSFTNLFTNHKLILYYSCKIILLHQLQCKFGL